MFHLEHRTNNLVESHNSQLSAAIRVNAGFFAVLEILKEDESRKGHDMGLIRNGDSVVFRLPAKKYSDRSAKIKVAQDELLDNKLSPDEFLCRLTFRHNKWVQWNMANFVEGNVSEEDEHEADLISVITSASNDDIEVLARFASSLQ